MCLISFAMCLVSLYKMLKSNRLSLCCVYVLLMTVSRIVGTNNHNNNNNISNSNYHNANNININSNSNNNKNTESVDQTVSYAQQINLYNVLNEENLEVALKQFLDVWNQTHSDHNTDNRQQQQHQQQRQHQSRPQQLDSTGSNASQLSSWQSDSPSDPSLAYSPVSPPRWAKQGFSQELLSQIKLNREKNSPHKNEEELSSEELSVTANCTRCVMQEEAKSRRLESIKVNILNKLGFKVAPNITGKSLHRIPPLHHLLDRYNMLGDDPRAAVSSSASNGYLDDQDNALNRDEEADYEEFFVNAERSISFAQTPPKKLNIPPEVKCQYFKFSSHILNTHVSKAHLWVYVNPTKHMTDTTAWIVIYQIVRQENGNDSPTLLHVRAKKVEVSSKKGTWITIELKKLVSQWFTNPDENLGLVIHSYDNDGKELSIIEVNENEDSSQLPFIEVRVESKSINRKRRMVGLNCGENSNEVRCCRYPLTVDFEGFGWDWIIAPKRYEANYCSGECPFVFLQKYPHTHLVQQANPSGSAGPCCSPIKMSSISMLYFDDNYNIIYGMLPGMVVDRCGCS